MSISALATEFSREPFYFVQIEVGGQTYLFCPRRSPLPAWLPAIPCLSGAPVITPAEADITGGTGLRASVSCRFDDFADSDLFGTVSAPVNFWPTWRARHPYYEGARLSYFTGYLRLDDNGNDVPLASVPYGDFIRREYLIDRIQWGGGKATITAKDPLKLTSNNRTVIPALSRGALKTALTSATTTVALDPAGIGAEYPASGFVRVRAEVMGFTRSGDTLTLTRAQYNTQADDHAAGDTVQLCAALSGTVDQLVSQIMQAAGVSTSFINSAAWAAEAAAYLPGLLSTLLTEPTGCQTLLKELAEQAPHFIYWDDKANQVQFVAIKEPPPSPTQLTADSNILKDSFDVEDAPEMRVSRVFVYFGQFDPTKKLDDASNYRQAFIRVDPTSESNYGSPRVKIIYSRWLSNTNKAGAIRLAARIGRRFSSVPKKIKFALDPKDQIVWTGTPVAVLHPDIVNGSGAPTLTPFQLTSAAERPSRYEFKGTEYLYGPSVPEDEEIDEFGKTVVISGEQYGLNLRAIYDSLFPTLEPDDIVKFIFDSAALVGGTTEGAYSVVTGSWAGLATPITLDVRGRILGRGGKGGDGVFGADQGRENGSPAIRLDAPVILDNSGTIGAGGAGGVRAYRFFLGTTVALSGGGGAGWPVGAAGSPTFIDPPTSLRSLAYPQRGGQLLGGAGAVVSPPYDPDTWPSTSGAGRNAGAPDTLGRPQPAAINRNGYAITYINAGDIRGPIV